MVAKTTLNKRLEDFDEVLVKWFNEFVLAGLAVGVVHNGELVYTKGMGYANIEKGEPVTMDSVFRIGSISKTFVSFGIMQLVEQGKIDLDAPVNTYLKAYTVMHKDINTKPVTVRHMLTHTSGIGEMRGLADLTQPVGGLGAKPDEPEVNLTDYYKGLLRPEIAPEQKWAYANHAFATLGQIIEDVTGVPFEDHLLETVFKPLGMEHSDFLLRERVKPQLCQGYVFKKNKFEPIPYQRVVIGAAGSIFSSVNDMALYMTALMNDGENQNGRIVKKETLAQMTEHQLQADKDVFGFGLSFFLRKFEDQYVLNHDGGWPGFVSSMFVSQKDKLGVIVFTNTANGAPNIIATDLMRRLLGQEDPLELVGKAEIRKDPHNWRNLCGLYSPSKGLLTNARLVLGMGGELEVFVKNNQLMMKSLAGAMNKGTVLHRIDPDDPFKFHALDSMGKSVLRIHFRKDKAGFVDRLDFGANTSFGTFYKRPFQNSVKMRVLVAGGVVGGLVLLLLAKLFGKKKKS